MKVGFRICFNKSVVKGPWQGNVIVGTNEEVLAFAVVE
jgi:hypothetical protein